MCNAEGKSMKPKPQTYINDSKLLNIILHTESDTRLALVRSVRFSRSHGVGTSQETKKDTREGWEG